MRGRPESDTAGVKALHDELTEGGSQPRDGSGLWNPSVSPRTAVLTRVATSVRSSSSWLTVQLPTYLQLVLRAVPSRQLGLLGSF
ncbi:hypothetical protein IMZ48_27970 [Candidatus Bathyarchaeota archaeon]|nr:hypothetical protein [Candidatus Bathyarchaeota archaeon]